MFDKDEYRKNRKAGKRGQGAQPETRGRVISGGTVNLTVRSRIKKDLKGQGKTIRAVKQGMWMKLAVELENSDRKY